MIRAALFVLAASLAPSLYEEANRLFEQKQFPAAAATVEAALRADPTLVPALTLKAKLAMAANRNEIAEACLLSAVHINPHSQYAQFLLGFYYYLQNDFKKALAPLELARQLDPEAPRTYLYLAMTQEGLANPEAALPLYEKAESLEASQGKQSAETLVAFARLLFTLGRFDECERRIENALAQDPQSRDAHYERARLLLRKGAAAAAAAEGEKALLLEAVGTSNRQVYFLLSRAYLQAGDSARAELNLALFRASAPTLRR